jgi:hypothetical protein
MICQWYSTNAAKKNVVHLLTPIPMYFATFYVAIEAPSPLSFYIQLKSVGCKQFSCLILCVWERHIITWLFVSHTRVSLQKSLWRSAFERWQNGNGVEVANNNACGNNNYLGCCWLQVATKVLSAWELSTHVFNIHIKHSHSAHPLFIQRAQQVCCVFVAHDGIHSIRTHGKLNANVLWNCSKCREREYKLANWTYFVQSII